VNHKPPISARYADLLNEQDDLALLNLVEDLDALYTSHQLPTHLELLVEAGRSAAGEQSQLSDHLPEQPGTLSSFVPQRHARWSRLNTPAAVLFTVLLVGALLGTFALVHSNRPAAPNSTTVTSVCEASPLPPFTSPLSLKSIQMMSASEGWGLTLPQGKNQQENLLHTSDGGCHWRIVSPAFYSLTSTIDYISGTAVWAIAVENSSGDTFVARTTDGGREWSYYPLNPTPGGPTLPGVIESPSVTFLTPEIGWLVVNQPNQALPGSYGLALYHTTDGGITWKKLTSNIPFPADWAANIKLGGAGVPLTLRFLNTSTGWMTGTNLITSSSRGQGVLLYVTNDGGLTWQPQELPLNCGVALSSAQTVMYPPQFFSQRDGLLTASSWSPLGLCVYATHDGGASWQSTSFLPFATNPQIQTDRFSPTPAPQFTDAQFGWLWEGSSYQPPYMLVTTSDGGQHWTSSQPSLPAGYNVSQVQFVSPLVGWLLANKGSGGPELFQTLDGGKSWNPIHYSYEPYVA
jgi:photosystem II stability/assembly factor-like uncharacterized protein